jgi:hypothetical protein
MGLLGTYRADGRYLPVIRSAAELALQTGHRCIPAAWECDSPKNCNILAGACWETDAGGIGINWALTLVTLCI